LNDNVDQVAIQGGRVSHIFMPWAIAKAHREALTGQGYARTGSTSSPKGIGGQGNPDFYGATVIADNDCPATTAYFVDQRHLKLETLKQANFKKTPFVTLQSNGQLAQLAYKVTSVQLCTNNRRRHSVETSLTGS